MLLVNFLGELTQKSILHTLSHLSFACSGVVRVYWVAMGLYKYYNVIPQYTFLERKPFAVFNFKCLSNKNYQNVTFKKMKTKKQ